MICVQSLIEICLRRLLFSEGKCLDGGKNLLAKSIEYIVWWWVYSEVYCWSDLRLSPTDKLELWNVFDYMRRAGKNKLRFLSTTLLFKQSAQFSFRTDSSRRILCTWFNSSLEISLNYYCVIARCHDFRWIHLKLNDFIVQSVFFIRFNSL